ncbi:E3 ubiquitin-protein ligase RING1 [Lucilia sericata]|uniref:E3 ubiquitin-protein ligase RING1 n=1 Tax=Lucilia sericata TaxID=13632 RepID=UPI0018A879ED|nr:E3 ubiquitin-protein ligase RING1 [Lucilia sericata]
MMERSPPPPQAPESVVDTTEQNCKVCNDRMCEGQECLLISECSHAFHRSCIETYLSNSSECPNCKRPCALSELRRIDFPVQTQPMEKAKNQPQRRPRGAANKHVKHFTRSQARNLFHDTQTSLAEGSSNFGLSTPQRNPPNTNVNNSPHNNQQSQTFDYAQLNYMIENTVSRLLQNLNLAPIAQTQNPNVQPVSIPNIPPIPY